MSTSSYPRLEQFFGAYFHQDWPFDASNSAEVVQAYRKTATPSSISGLLKELAALRAEKLKEAQLGKRIEALGACVVPSAEGLNWADWLATIESGLQAAPAAKPKRTSGTA